MPDSMTGYGEARGAGERLSLAITLRGVNGRALKVTLRAPEPYHLLEPEFEKVIRQTVSRGTVHVQIRCERPATGGDFRINAVALKSYVAQIQDACGPAAAAVLPGVLALPGVVDEAAGPEQLTDDWPLFERVLRAALEKFNAMRRIEGVAMAKELRQLAATIVEQLAQIRRHLPVIVPAYRERILERVRNLLGQAGATLNEDAVIREVALFADRSDVNEEIVRLDSHLEQFDALLADGSAAPGNKLGFVAQEMGREANTLGSKAGDVTVSRHVVEIKAALEKVKELVQNVE